MIIIIISKLKSVNFYFKIFIINFIYSKNSINRNNNKKKKKKKKKLKKNFI